MTEISQEAREAAADYAANGNWGDGRDYWLANADESHPLIQSFQRAIDNERERCAKVAERWIDPVMATDHENDCFRKIAATIRGTKP